MKSMILRARGLARILTGLVLALGLNSQVAYSMIGVGQSVYPMRENTHFLNAEATGVVSDEGGAGFQMRYTYRVYPELTFDGGLGVSGGDRSSRMFVSADYQVLADTINQPRFSLKTQLTNSKDFQVRNNTLSVAPTLSKGFYFWGQEGHPYVSLPIGVQLNEQTKNYEGIMNLNIGIMGNIPLREMSKMTVALEVFLDLNDSYSGALVSLGVPLNF